MSSKKTKDKEIRTPDSAVDSTPDLEKALAELEHIVEKLEAGDLTLDDSLKQFERGVQLTRHCQTALRKAEQKVDILLRKSGVEGGFDAEAFDTGDADDDAKD